MRAPAVTVPILYQWQTKVRTTTNVWKPHPITEGLGGVVHEQAKNFYDQMKRYTQRYKLPEKLEDYEGFGEIKTVNQMMDLIRTNDYYTRKEAMNLAKSFLKDKNRRWFHVDDPLYGDCEIDGGYIFDVLMYCSETREFVIRKGKYRKAKEDFKICYEAGESSDTMYPICFDLNSKSE